jgi:hypothetical protein
VGEQGLGIRSYKRGIVKIDREEVRRPAHFERAARRPEASRAGYGRRVKRAVAASGPKPERCSRMERR